MALRVHVLPRLGRARVESITVDDGAWLIGEMQKDGLAGWTISRAALVDWKAAVWLLERRHPERWLPVSALSRVQ
jgi:hypothetical protein